MFRQALVVFLVAAEAFLHSALHASIDIQFVAILVFIHSLDDTEIRVVVDYRGVYGTSGTATERKIIHGIEEIRLALSV